MGNKFAMKYFYSALRSIIMFLHIYISDNSKETPSGEQALL